MKDINQFTNISYISNIKVMDLWVIKTFSIFFHNRTFIIRKKNTSKILR